MVWNREKTKGFSLLFHVGSTIAAFFFFEIVSAHFFVLSCHSALIKYNSLSAGKVNFLFASIATVCKCLIVHGWGPWKQNGREVFSLTFITLCFVAPRSQFSPHDPFDAVTDSVVRLGLNIAACGLSIRSVAGEWERGVRGGGDVRRASYNTFYFSGWKGRFWPISAEMKEVDWHWEDQTKMTDYSIRMTSVFVCLYRAKNKLSATAARLVS